MLGYSEADVNATLMLYKETRKSELESQIEKLRLHLDNCDDVYVRGKLARKIKRLQVKINEL